MYSITNSPRINVTTLTFHRRVLAAWKQSGSPRIPSLRPGRTGLGRSGHGSRSSSRRALKQPQTAQAWLREVDWQQFRWTAVSWRGNTCVCVNLQRNKRCKAFFPAVYFFCSHYNTAADGCCKQLTSVNSSKWRTRTQHWEIYTSKHCGLVNVEKTEELFTRNTNTFFLKSTPLNTLTCPWQ